MALPPLEHQISISEEIVLAETVSFQDDSGGYRILETLKSNKRKWTEKQLIDQPIGIFKLLGYNPVIGQQVVLCYYEGELIELLPVDEEGVILYGQQDQTVARTLSLAEFIELLVNLRLRSG